MDVQKKYPFLLVTNFFGVLNDNFLKTITGFLAISWVAQDIVGVVISAAAGALVLPYVFLSPLAGVLAKKYDRKAIVKWGKIAELPIMALSIIGYVLQNPWIILSSILCMGIQSCLFSPAKYSLVRDICGEEKLSQGMGMMEGISFLGMLTGTVLAAFIAEDTQDLSTLYVLLMSFAIIGLAFSYFIPKVKVQQVEEESNDSIRPIKSLVTNWKNANKYKGLNTTTIVLSVFWWLVASLQIGLVIYCNQIMGLSSTKTGILLSFAAIGISIGSIISGYIFKNNYRKASVVISGLIVSICSLFIFFHQMTFTPFAITLVIMAISAGFFKVPLDTSLQQKAKGSFLSIALAMFNQVSFIFILLASATMSLISLFLESTYLFLVLGIVFIATNLYILLTNTIFEKNKKNFEKR